MKAVFIVLNTVVINIIANQIGSQFVLPVESLILAVSICKYSAAVKKPEISIPLALAYTVDLADMAKDVVTLVS